MKPALLGLLAVACILGFVQIASDAVFARSAAANSLASHLSPAWGVAMYERIERIAPMDFVEATLARAAIDRHDWAGAERYLARMGPSARKDDLEGLARRDRGDTAGAMRFFVAAQDDAAVQAEVGAREDRGDLKSATALESELRARLAENAIHPDLLAEADWHLGKLDTEQAQRELGNRGLLEAGMREYRAAIALAPFSDKYLLAAGTQALDLGDAAGAGVYFRRALEADPASAEAFGGLALVARREGNPVAARQYAERSRAIDPAARLLQRFDRELP